VSSRTSRCPASSPASTGASQNLRPLLSRQRASDLELLCELIEAGNVTPVIDSTYPLGRVADALRHLDSGLARGKVVITV
jgi:NADPH:quinone reductase-like Zn-dependent oxidoreductase